MFADVHKNGFIMFIASSLLHMLITCRLWYVIRRNYVSPEVNLQPRYDVNGIKPKIIIIIYTTLSVLLRSVL